MTDTGEFVSSDDTAFEAVNDENAYNEPWECSNIDEYVWVPKSDIPQHTSDGAGETIEIEGGSMESSSGSSSPKPFSSVARGGGYATVRANRDLNYNFSIPLNGSVSGTIRAGSTFRGRDSNNNGAPDLLEKGLRNGSVVAK